MDSRIALSALGTVVVAALAWNAWTLTRLETRVGQLEAEGALVQTPPASMEPHEVTYRGQGLGVAGRRTAMAVDPPEDAGADRDALVEELVGTRQAQVLGLDDPKMREELEALVVETQERQWQERREEYGRRWSDSMREEVASFADEHDLDARTTAGVIAVLEDYRVARDAAHDDMRSGDLSMFDVRAEMRALRDDAGADLLALVGDDRYEALRERVLPDRGPHH
ncbi:MAG: hypothetical protein JRJ84_12215 [Deltaproteobacteria bacterium]|nr:hypothetical protein [Deltaproteobacteria bacterium]